jgi:hypothetical protein
MCIYISSASEKWAQKDYVSLLAYVNQTKSLTASKGYQYQHS